MGYDPIMNESDFRDALGCFATGITVITTWDEDGAPVGMTANSFNSVSLDPPLILFSIAKSSERMKTFRECRHFAVNVLKADQQEYSVRFSKPGENGFDELTPARGPHGCPLLPNTLAHFECDNETSYEGGDHVIMIGRVRAIGQAGQGGPLLYFRGRYAGLDAAD